MSRAPGASSDRKLPFLPPRIAGLRNDRCSPDTICHSSKMTKRAFNNIDHSCCLPPTPALSHPSTTDLERCQACTVLVRWRWTATDTSHRLSRQVPVLPFRNFLPVSHRQRVTCILQASRHGTDGHGYYDTDCETHYHLPNIASGCALFRDYLRA